MQNSPVLVASVLASLLAATAGRADVTPEQVWQNWQDLSASYGQTLTVADESRSGDTLTVSGVVIASQAEDMSSTATVESIAFRDRGDGTVEITVSPSIPLEVTSTAPGDEPFTMTMTLEQPDLVVIASADTAETRYDITAPSLKLSLAAPPTASDPAEMTAVVDVAALAGSYAVASTDLSRVTSDMTADRLGLTLNAADPSAEDGGTIAISMSMTGLAGTSTGAMLSSEQVEDLAAVLASGFSTDGRMTYAGAEYTLDVTEPGGTTQSSGSFGPGSLSVALDKDRMAYGGTASDTRMRVSGSTIPFPELVASYAEAVFDLVMPVSKSDAPQDFSVLTRIVDLAVSDEIWGMFDPNGALPRDPATLVIDLDGKARWLVDLFGPEAAEAENVPGELSALTVNDLSLRAVGASVDGKGAFTFDNSDLTTFDGMPAPTGVLDLTLVGANALLDRLSQSGLLPPDQVMGARMMMGLFTRPGTGEDTLTSTVEFKDKGLFVNGQQLQ